MLQQLRRWWKKSESNRLWAVPRYQEFAAEQLERREMLAGNVTAMMRGGDLIVGGDNADNAIEIRRVGGTTYLIRGMDSTTTVNGEASVYIRGISDDFRLHMKGGNDRVELQNCVIRDDLTVIGGHGNDVFLLDNCTVGDDLTFQGGSGSDGIRLSGVSVSDTTRINTSSGSDAVLCVSSRFGGRIHANTGHGDDLVLAADCDFGDRLRTVLGGGNDRCHMQNLSFLDEAKVHGGSGFDHNYQAGNNRVMHESSIEADDPILGVIGF